MSSDELRRFVQDSYPQYQIDEIVLLENLRLPAGVRLRLDDIVLDRRFDPYTGRDLGDPFPPVLRVLEWLVDVHDNLLIGQLGRQINGLGGAALLLIASTGALLWWPGRARWRRSLFISSGLPPIRFIWQLHSTLGFWSFAILMVWSLTGIYFAFPSPVEAVIDALDTNRDDFVRPGEGLLLAMVAGHFGRFGPLPVRFVWMALGLIPVVLLITGVLLWWKRRPSR